MQSVINLFQDSDNSEIIKEKVDNKDNSDNYMLSHSLSQGSKFKDYQNKIHNNLEKSGSLLIKENFDNMSDGSNLAIKSYDVLKQTKLTPQNQKILSDLQEKYNNTLVEYQTLQAK